MLEQTQASMKLSAQVQSSVCAHYQKEDDPLKALPGRGDGVRRGDI